MTKKEFLDLVNIHKVILDGATGSNLQKRGMPTGVCPEEWILENADVMCGLQREYIQAGTNVLYAPTFSGNRIKLEEYGLADKLEQMNTDLVAISKRAIQEEHAEGKVFIAGDITMTGVQVEPLGPMPFEELVSVYKESRSPVWIKRCGSSGRRNHDELAGVPCGCDRSKEVTTLPIMVTLSFNEDGRTLFGTNPETAALVLTTLSADAIGINCSTGGKR